MDLCDILVAKAAQFVLDTAHNDGLAPMSIAVYDRNGLPTYFMRMQNAVKLGIPLAYEKAKTSALMGVTTRQMHDRLQNEKLTLADFCGSATTSLVGGVPIIYEEKILGGVGVSGRKPVDDEKLAILFCEKFAEFMKESIEK